MKVFHSDNGKEFCNSAMDRILKESGIQRRLTIPHTPEQNGAAERKNRTLVETARCLLAQSGLSTHFWAEAINTANYIRNRCTTKSLNGHTPHELWKGDKPNISHLRSFGSKALVLNKNPNKGKFESRAIECIFVGYAGTSKGYRIWIPKDHKVIVARDVKFLDGFDTKATDEDFIYDNTINGRMKILGDDADLSRNQTVEIANDDKTLHHQIPENPDDADITTEDEHDDGDPPLQADENDDFEEDQPPARGPGRPRKLHTGKPGRPAKQYHMKGPIQQPNRPIANEDNPSSNENIANDPEWFDAQLAMTAFEIPFSQAV
ncbi:retrovirus-related pol polyprotein from transposon tnt 1-94 [Lasius niger]|uniref:Retrovirus-related pol polyprotein from transposon tnt 1-94 n=2 Tax=Lasius TaxID=488720 RepID=A0A0J7NI28_LASNI|nr:retrovirus-related pol polyprotein from transposon tnt 1-94 [Lasius niger]